MRAIGTEDEAMVKMTFRAQLRTFLRVGNLFQCQL